MESIDPYEGAGNPAFVSDAIFNSDPFPLDLQNSHGKVFVHRTPGEQVVFGSGSFSQVGLVVLDDRAFVFFSDQFSVYPINIAVQILHPIPASFFLHFPEGHVLENLPKFFIMRARALPQIGFIVADTQGFGI